MIVEIKDILLDHISTDVDFTEWTDIKVDAVLTQY
jgi:hypothetical protein